MGSMVAFIARSAQVECFAIHRVLAIATILNALDQRVGEAHSHDLSGCI